MTSEFKFSLKKIESLKLLRRGVYSLELMPFLLGDQDDVPKLVSLHVALPDHVVSKLLGLY